MVDMNMKIQIQNNIYEKPKDESNNDTVTPSNPNSNPIINRILHL